MLSHMGEFCEFLKQNTQAPKTDKNLNNDNNEASSSTNPSLRAPTSNGVVHVDPSMPISDPQPEKAPIINHISSPITQPHITKNRVHPDFMIA